jgi:hypothetical protein
MPIIGSFASGGSRGFGGLRTYGPFVPPQTYFVSYDTGASVNLTINGSAIDSSDNSYVVGQWSNNNGYMAKYNNAGVGQWYRQFYESQGVAYDWGNQAVIDSNDNLWITHTTDLSGANSPALSKVNVSTGTFASTSYMLSSSGGNNYIGGRLSVDASNNLYFTGQGDYDGSGFKLFTCKYNSSGVMQWQRRYLAPWSTGYAVTVDSSSNSYTGGRHNASGSYVAFLAKRNTSGTNQWQRTYTESAGENYINDVHVDLNDNTYFCSVAGTAGSRSSHLVKIDNASGDIIWQRRITGSPFISAITTDLSGNIYVGGFATGTDTGLIMKYNSSGTLQWSRTMTSINYFIRIIWKNNSLYLSSNNTIGGYTSALTIKVPDDGSKTGTYINGSATHVYAAGSVSDTSGTLTAGSGGATDSAGTMSTPSYSMTNIASSPTRYKTTI